ncbi:hypothetical protein DFH09DRAFT_1453018 [Mycena vulgaris]|nr:hypothetical protein DFH09DRAFT_1453018 [Mycena vulgaris]
MKVNTEGKGSRKKKEKKATGRHHPRARNGGGHPPRPRCLHRSTLPPSTPPSAPRASYHPVAIVPRSIRATTATRRGHSNPDAAVLIGLPPSARRHTPRQIARRHPRATHRLPAQPDRVRVPTTTRRTKRSRAPPRTLPRPPRARVAQYCEMVRRATVPRTRTPSIRPLPSAASGPPSHGRRRHAAPPDCRHSDRHEAAAPDIPTHARTSPPRNQRRRHERKERRQEARNAGAEGRARKGRETGKPGHSTSSLMPTPHRRRSRNTQGYRRPTQRVQIDTTKTKDEETTEGGLEAKKREGEGRQGRSRGRIRWQCTSASTPNPRPTGKRSRRQTAQGTQRHPQARHEDKRIRARQRHDEKYRDGSTHATHNATLMYAEHEQRTASSTDKRAHRRPVTDLRPADGEE